jgi:hypothetical protein
MPLGPGAAKAVAALRSCDVIHARQPVFNDTARSDGTSAGTFLYSSRSMLASCRSSSILNAVQQLAWASIGDPVVRRSAGVVAINSRVRDWLTGRFANTRLRSSQMGPTR